MWQDAGYPFDKVRYGNRHYILLLIRIKKEFCSIIFQRIESACNKGPGDIFVSFIEKWENAPDVAGCRIPLLIKLTLRNDALD